MSRKTAVASSSPLAIRAADFSHALAAIAADQYGARSLYDDDTKSNAGAALSLIKGLRSDLNDADYAAALVIVFGDGLKGKASKVRGTLATDLEAACVNARSIAHQLSIWRSVARSFATGIPAEAATEGATMRSIYNALAKSSDKGGRPKADKAAPAPSVLTAADFEAWARENTALAFEVLERAMVARKETLKASALHAMRGDFISVKG